MISSQVLQSAIDDLRAITRIDLCIMDLEGKAVATTFSEDDIEPKDIQQFADSPADSQVIQGHHFFKIFDERTLEYVLISKGSHEDAYMIGKVAVSQIQSLIIAYKERFDKNNFIQNLLLDNLLLVDVYNRAKKLHIDIEAKRVVFVIETKYEKDSSALETVKSLFSNRTKDFITAVDERNIILVKALEENEEEIDVHGIARTLVDMLNAEAMSQVRVSYGTIIEEIKEVSKSYKEAKMALDVGKIFYSERNIIAYSTLGIGRLIYQLPIPLCKMFMNEVFGGKLPAAIDDETLMTINKFFEN
ncbi:MAG TPA: PucR family transcriptional regulator, partial [Candidatus Merdenecus merdavium]|nr:PucR family transcriptional regulator [Candidatus Merdenecus merdavium]